MHVVATLTTILILQKEDKHSINKYITENAAHSNSAPECNSLVRLKNSAANLSPSARLQPLHRVSLLVVDQMAVDLFAELGNWLANVSSPYEETSSPNCALMMSPRMVTKRLQDNCQARRTDQQPSDQQPLISAQYELLAFGSTALS
ncbi:hypothetical protein CLF_113253 [Clonorchis sinensis]|uniref:Uncharacterized protein n=1 Tax=Clonorchis sinensis TaxID=79923 RepID=G7YY04_CLOSI|nr:hypothetical protein CLF_113253 [Clonorchis sinensis]